MRDAVRRTIEFTNSDDREYRLNDEIATLIVRPRGWHLVERHVMVDGEPVSASLFDFGLHFYHNAEELLGRGSGPYFYLPKIESHLEARLWADVFRYVEEDRGIPSGSIRATTLIETLLAAFEMDEILYELRDYAAGLNAGRWDYIFSAIKVFRSRADTTLPDRAQVTMAVPFMRAYSQLLVKTCHRRGAHAIGGMSAFIPSRNPAVNETAMANVQADKQREATTGFDGAWVAHPALIPVAREIFDDVIGDNLHQKRQLRDDVTVTATDLADVRVPDGTITEAGVRNNINVALQYVDSWFAGNGAAAIHNLMEDAATAEISRAQLWQWIRHGATMDDGRAVTADLYSSIRDEELATLRGGSHAHIEAAAALLDQLVLDEGFVDFLTLPAYERLK
jgi:malate synthase